MPRMFLTPSWRTIFKCQRSSLVKQTCQVNCLPSQINKQTGGVQTRQSSPSQCIEKTSESRTILASAWESERSKGGERRWRGKGKTMKRTSQRENNSFYLHLFLHHPVSNGAAEERSSSWALVFHSFLHKSQPICKLPIKFSRSWLRSDSLSWGRVKGME